MSTAKIQPDCKVCGAPNGNHLSTCAGVTLHTSRTLPQLIEEGKKEFETTVQRSAELTTGQVWAYNSDIKSFLTSFALKIAESAKEETVITWGSANSQTEQAEKWEGFLQGKKEGK